VTKPDKTGHLTVAQENAIDALVLGKSDREAAEVAGVARQTVTGWRLHHPYFQAELNRRRMGPCSGRRRTGSGRCSRLPSNA
jgi:hypothetical protein